MADEDESEKEAHEDVSEDGDKLLEEQVDAECATNASRPSEKTEYFDDDDDDGRTGDTGPKMSDDKSDPKG